jgi:methyltransferase-like protein 6
MKIGAIIIFRDYSANDAAQLRFKEDRKIEDRLFVRQDGTLSYFFTIGTSKLPNISQRNLILFLDELRSLFENYGFETLECDVVVRRTTNLKEGIDSERRFIQGRWKKIR